jgi:hypothetical protein
VRNGVGSATGPAGLFVEYSNTVVPEPSTYALALGLGTLGFIVARRRFVRRS